MKDLAYEDVMAILWRTRGKADWIPWSRREVHRLVACWFRDHLANARLAGKLDEARIDARRKR